MCSAFQPQALCKQLF